MHADTRRLKDIGGIGTASRAEPLVCAVVQARDPHLLAEQRQRCNWSRVRKARAQ